MTPRAVAILRPLPVTLRVGETMPARRLQWSG